MFVLLFLFWILLNGKINLEITIIGLILCGFVYAFMCFFLKFSFKKDLMYCKNLGLLVVYFALLIVEVVKSNWNIITLIWSKREIEPEVKHFNVDLKSRILRVFFANAITLTPGTITIDLKDDEYTVHALRSEYIGGIEDSGLLKILRKMEGQK